MAFSDELPFRDLPPGARRHVLVFQGHQFADRFAMGLTVAIVVLALQSRGLDVAQIATLFAIYAATTMLTELPFGGLADGIGRKPVFLLATGASLAALTVFILSDTFAPLAFSFALVGLGRALRSGTLDAWFVEGVKARAPGADIQPALARAQLANFTGLGLGAIVGGLLPGLVGSEIPLIGQTIYDVSYVASIALTGVVVLYTVLLIHEPPRPLDPRAVLVQAKAVPATIRHAAALAVTQPVILLLLSVLALMLLATNPVEVLWPAVLQTMLEPERAAALIGVLTAGYFLAIAVGAALAPSVNRVFRRRRPITLVAALLGLAFAQACLALQDGVWGFVLTFVLFSVLLGLSETPASSILHANVPDSRRSTMLSLRSLVQQMGAMVGLLVLGGIGEATTVGIAWIVGTAALILAAALAGGLLRRA
jgi:MFS family permease